MSPPLSPTPLSPIDGEQDLRHRVKRELRKRALSVRKATPSDACLERSTLIVERLLDLPAIRDARRSVALFWPIEAKHEVDLRRLDEALRRRGVRVAYPAIPDGDDDPLPRGLRFHFVDDVSSLVERGFGFAEPASDTAALDADLHELDVVVVPALALDPTGQRIGYGAGYYDSALRETKVTKVGVIFDFQLLSEIPATKGDVAVDWVVTDRRVLQVDEGADAARAEPAPELPCST
jgi:5-formyltetrahydrofolate cyclo-ligase